MTQGTRNLHILYVEDEIDLQAIIKQVFKKYSDLVLEVATNAEEALENMKIMDFDIVITDHYLPGEILGIDLLERIKNDNPKIRRILITGAVEPEVFSDAKEKAQPHAIYRKPVILEQIIDDFLNY